MVNQGAALCLQESLSGAGTSRDYPAGGTGGPPAPLCGFSITPIITLTSPLLPGLAAPGFLGPPYCLGICDLTPGKRFCLCSFTARSFCSVEIPAFPQEPSSLPPAQSQQVPCKTKTPAEHCQPACPTPSRSQQSPNPSGVNIVIARKLFIYHDLSDITVNAFQSTRSVKINCKEIKTAN